MAERNAGKGVQVKAQQLLYARISSASTINILADDTPWAATSSSKLGRFSFATSLSS